MFKEILIGSLVLISQIAVGSSGEYQCILKSTEQGLAPQTLNPDGTELTLTLDDWTFRVQSFESKSLRVLLQQRNGVFMNYVQPRLKYGENFEIQFTSTGGGSNPLRYYASCGNQMQEFPSRAEGKKLTCTGTWGAVAQLDLDKEVMTIRAPGETTPTTYKIENVEKEESQTSYSSKGVILIIKCDTTKSELKKNGATWLLGFGCKG